VYRVVYTRHICFSTKRGDEEIEIPAYVRKTLSERAYSNLSSFSLDHAPFTIFVVTVNKSREKRVRGLLLRLKEARKNAYYETQPITSYPETGRRSHSRDLTISRTKHGALLGLNAMA